MLVRKFLPLILLIGLLQLAQAAERKASISAPTDGMRATIESSIVGYFWSSAGLVAIEGISNAAHARALVSIEADRVVLPPGQTYEWLERAGQVYVSPLPKGRITEVQDAWPAADLISFNSGGSAAVLYRSGRLQVIIGLPDAPQIAREIASPQGTNDVAAVAISDDSNTLLVASSTGLYAASGDDVWRFVMPGQASAVAFLHHSSDALVALRDLNQIYLLKNTTAAQLLADSGQGIDSPRAIAVSDDGRLAVVLNAAGRDALVLDLRTGITTHITLGAAARDVQRGRDGTLMFIPQQGTSPWLMDTKSGVLSFAPELPDTARER